LGVGKIWGPVPSWPQHRTASGGSGIPQCDMAQRPGRAVRSSNVPLPQQLAFLQKDVKVLMFIIVLGSESVTLDAVCCI